MVDKEQDVYMGKNTNSHVLSALIQPKNIPKKETKNCWRGFLKSQTVLYEIKNGAFEKNCVKRHL